MFQIMICNFKMRVSQNFCTSKSSIKQSSFQFNKNVIGNLWRVSSSILLNPSFTISEQHEATTRSVQLIVPIVTFRATTFVLFNSRI
jgi:hypothetical protein